MLQSCEPYTSTTDKDQEVNLIGNEEERKRVIGNAELLHAFFFFCMNLSSIPLVENALASQNAPWSCQNNLLVSFFLGVLEDIKLKYNLQTAFALCTHTETKVTDLLHGLSLL